MATVAEIEAKLAAVATNQEEAAAEAGRIRVTLEELRQAIADLIANGATPEQLQSLHDKADGLVGSSQGLEDSLRSTT